MKFAHMADCHIGSWRDPKLKDISTKAFTKAVDICIKENVDFILIAGDLFNTSLPAIDTLKLTVVKLKELKDKNIPVYLIAGSHDFSPSGKTMLDVLEGAGLFVNVSKGEVVDNKLKLKFTIDKKTGAKITGLLGKRGALEKTYYEHLAKEHLEKEEGYKIFMFHCAIAEYKPKELEHVDSSPLSFLPKNFNYYAGGHVHYVFNTKEENYGTIAYPGPLFPNSFKELEDLEKGGFYIIENDTVQWHSIQMHNIYSIKIDGHHKTPEQIEKEIQDETTNKELYNTIVTVRVSGTLSQGKPTDIHFKELFQKMYDKSAYFVMKNTAALVAKEFEEIKIDATSIEEAEASLIKEHAGQIPLKDVTPEQEMNLTKKLLKALATDKKEGERVLDFSSRVKSEVNKLLKEHKLLSK